MALAAIQRRRVPPTLLVLVGFIGVMIMVRPGPDMDIGVVFALLASFCYAVVLLLTRHLSHQESGHHIAFYSMFFFGIWAVIGGGLVSWLDLPPSKHPGIGYLLLPWSEPALPAFALLLLVGVTAAVGHLLFALA